MLCEPNRGSTSLFPLGVFPIDVLKTRKQHAKSLNITEKRETNKTPVISPEHNDDAAQRNQISIDIEDKIDEDKDIITQKSSRTAL